MTSPLRGLALSGQSDAVIGPEGTTALSALGRSGAEEFLGQAAAESNCGPASSSSGPSSSTVFQRLLQELAQEHERELQNIHEVVATLRSENDALHKRVLAIPLADASVEDIISMARPDSVEAPDPALLEKLDMADASTHQDGAPLIPMSASSSLSGTPRTPAMRQLDPVVSFDLTNGIESPRPDDPGQAMFNMPLPLQANVPPTAPVTPTLEEVEDGSLKIAWTLPNISPPVTSTALKLRAAGEAWQPIDASDCKKVLVLAPTSSMRISSLRPHVAYEAMVKVQNSLGWSEYSPASATHTLQGPIPRGKRIDTERDRQVPQSDPSSQQNAPPAAGRYLSPCTATSVDVGPPGAPHNRPAQALNRGATQALRASAHTGAPHKSFMLCSVWEDFVSKRQEHGLDGKEWNRTSGSDFSKAMIQNFSSVDTAPEAIAKDACFVSVNLVSHPSSARRLSWDLFGAALIGYDIIMIPMIVFEMPDNAFFIAMNWVTLIFWTADIFASFIVGYVDKGFTIMEPSMIAKHYLRTWLLPDLFIVIADWVYNMAQASGTAGVGDVGRLARGLRSVRTLRLLRLMKLKRILAIIEDRVNSEYLSIIGDVVKLILVMLFLGHIIACVWYKVGTSGKDGDMPNWLQASSLETAPLEMRYVMSLHWSLCQLMLETMDVEAQNIYERWFTIATLNFGLLVFSSVVSRITNSMMQLHRMGQSTAHQFWLLRRFLKDRGVPKALASRVQRYLEYACQKQQQYVQESSVSILELLSSQLRGELQYAIVVPHLSTHLLFSSISNVSDVSMPRLSAVAVRRRAFACEDSVFSRGEIATDMCFVVSGELMYMGEQSQWSVPVCADEWLCEASLWTPWTHLGTLQSMTECDLIAIDSKKFAETMCANPLTWSLATEYAEGFVRNLNQLNTDKLSDLAIFQPGDGFHEDIVAVLSKYRGGTSPVMRRMSTLLRRRLEA